MAFLIAAAILLCGLLSSIRLHYSLTVEGGRATLLLRLRFFFRLIPLRLAACLSFLPLQLYVGSKAIDLGDGKMESKAIKKAWLLLKALLQHRRSWLRAEKLRIRGVAGSAEDACAAILWAGALSILLDCGARFLIDPPALSVQVLPVCGARSFCLNLEGIVTLRIWQIIGVAIRQQISGTRGKQLWRTLLKTS